MKFLFALPGFGDQNYRRCLHQAGPVEHVLMSFYYLEDVPSEQVQAYVRGGYPEELAWREQRRCAERWLTVPDWPSYMVSDRGRVKRLETRSTDGHVLKEKILKPQSTGRCVYLYKGNGRTWWISVAYLVLLAFEGPPPLPYGISGSVARHLDDDHSNNVLTNLAWGTQGDNLKDAERNGKVMRVAKDPARKSARLSAACKGKPWSEARRAAQVRRQ